MTVFVLFILGTCVGSFLNVLIDRIPRGESVLVGRSHCDHCRKKLSGRDLVPVLSFLLLGGRCRYCHSPIPARTLLVEVLTALSFVGVYLALPMFSPDVNLCSSNGPFVYLNFCLFESFYWLWIASAMIVIFFVDLEYGIIPDVIVFSTLLLSIIKFIFTSVEMQHLDVTSLLATLIAGVFFLLLHVGTKGKGMGLGDVKFVGLMGLILGHPKLWVAIYVSFLTGAIVGVILIVYRRLKLRQTIAFGPFLVMGTVVALFFGETIYTWWIKLLV